MRNLYVCLIMAAVCGLAVPAAAQTDQPRVISGTITAVNGHLVTIQRSNGSIVVNDQPALDNQTTGNVAVGRQVVALGHWQNGTFYATSFADANVYGYDGLTGQYAGVGRLRGAVRGTITKINGHLVTVQSTDNAANTLVINDQPALNRKLTGNMTVGRDILASGYWLNGTFYATTISDASAATSDNDDMPDLGVFTRVPDSLSGTITGVSGNQVTLQQSTRSIVVNDQPALNRKSTGNVAVGRQVVANGYWLHGVFFVTSFSDATP
jgi:hypothetical protein